MNIQVEASAQQLPAVLQQQNDHFASALLDPAKHTANEKASFQSKKNETKPQTKSVIDALAAIPSVQIDRYGGEAGTARIRLRGARAFAPAYSVRGFPLSGTGNSEQNVDLIPVSFLGALFIYPDAPPFWLSTGGIGGNIEITPCRRSACFFFGQSPSTHLLKSTLRLGSFGYHQLTASDSVQFDRKQTEIFSTAEYSASQENYPVFNSTPGKTGFSSQLLGNNDFEKVSLAAGLTSVAFAKTLGKIDVDLVFGHEEKGIPGPFGAQSNERQKRNLLMGIARASRQFNTGLQWDVQLGVSHNTQSQENPDLSAQQTPGARHLLWQAKTWFLFPTEWLAREHSGLSLEFLQSRLVTLLPAKNPTLLQPPDTQASRNEFKPTLFESIVIPISQKFLLTAGAQGWISFSHLSGETENGQPAKEKPLSGYTLSLAGGDENTTAYVRFVRSSRRPDLAEILGNPNGVLPGAGLLPEVSEKLETGLNTAWGNIGYFRAKDTNLIFLQQINPLFFQYQNIERGTREGLFLDSSFAIFRFWQARFSYQALVTEMSRENQVSEIPRSPKHSFSATLGLENLPLAPMANNQITFSAYTGMSWQSVFYLDSANINKMQVPTVYNAGFSFVFFNNDKLKRYTISLDAYNLGNKVLSTVYNQTGYVEQVQSNGYLGYFPPGRRFYLSIAGEI